MKYFYVCFAVLAMSTALWAQGMDCQCEQTVTLSDATCTSPYNCPDQTGCASVQFTASCNGCYKFNVHLSCTTIACSDYNACASIYEGNTLIDYCFIQHCQLCQEACHVCLELGHTYTLYVCLTTCEGEGNCPAPMTCTAVGTVAYCGDGESPCGSPCVQ